MRSIMLRFGIMAVLAVGAAGCGGNANDLAVGECFDPPADIEGTVSDVAKHPCGEAHGAEVVFVGNFSPATDTYPASFQAFYSSACAPAFNAYTGLDYAKDTTYDLAAFKPTSESWGTGDRKVICYALRVDRATMNASIKKS